ncbi:hypothetical protein RhiirC2_872114 [Rhizophagus irregularis]|uniref:Uncharacterized protein n=1 Tax=Rhizophagus irregularis TaxID=588596 RepID=A0A2N1M370_9GLOM|nr:hypothetical protein RhiirC2_872114 [Rhizophagus irregularis]
MSKRKQPSTSLPQQPTRIQPSRTSKTPALPTSSTSRTQTSKKKQSPASPTSSTSQQTRTQSSQNRQSPAPSTSSNGTWNGWEISKLPPKQRLKIELKKNQMTKMGNELEKLATIKKRMRSMGFK